MEALVSILIFAFGILGLIGLEASAINFGVDAEDRNRAALFASEVASAMWLAGSVDTVNNAQLAAQAATWQTAISNAAATGLTNGTLTITTVPGLTNATGVNNAADITITWKPPYRVTTGGSSNSTLTTRVILP